MGRLSRLLAPRSIAVIGGDWAAAVVRQLLRSGFSGQIWPVHPTRPDMEGVPCVRDVAALPEGPDAAFVGLSRDRAPDVLRVLAGLGAGGAVSFASGFAEAGAEDRQAALVAAAGEMPVLGPNCYGILNYLDGVAIWPDQHGGQRVDSGVALISASSNIVINLTMQRRGLPIAYVVCLGNQAQTGLADVFNAVLDDPRVTAIGLYLEGIGDAQAFAEVAARARATGRPVVAIKAGRSAQGAEAALSHTAQMTGGAALSSAFLRQCGVAEVADPETLLETLKLVHVNGWLPGLRVGSLSCSGGEAGLMADIGDAYGLVFPELPGRSAQVLRNVLGPIPRVTNPLDYHTFIWGDVPRMRAVFEAMMAAENDLTVLVMDTPHPERCDARDWVPAETAWAEAQVGTGAKTAILSSLPDTMTEDRAMGWMAEGIVPLNGIAAGLGAIAAARWIENDESWRPHAPETTQAVRMLDEASAKSRIAGWGVFCPQSTTCANIEDLAEAATGLTAPLVLKGLGFAHKSEAGAVRVGLSHADLAQTAPMDGADGYLVEEMVADAVAELIVGLRRDPIYGAALTLGSGGVLTELVGDLETLILPASRNQIVGALSSLRVSRLIEGYRGRPPGDVDATCLAIEMLADGFLADRTCVSLEVNPLMIRPRGAVAVDALMEVEDGRPD